jgi:hypothetical protein
MLCAHDWCEAAAGCLPLAHLMASHREALAMGPPAAAEVLRDASPMSDAARAALLDGEETMPRGLSNRLQIWYAHGPPRLRETLERVAAHVKGQPLRCVRPPQRTAVPGALYAAFRYTLHTLRQRAQPAAPQRRRGTNPLRLLGQLASPCVSWTPPRLAQAYKALLVTGGDMAREAMRRAVVLAHLGGLDSSTGTTARPVSDERRHWLAQWARTREASWKPWADTPWRVLVSLRVCMGYIALVDLRIPDALASATRWRAAHRALCKRVAASAREEPDASLRPGAAASAMPTEALAWVRRKAPPCPLDSLTARERRVVVEAVRHGHALAVVAPPLNAAVRMTPPALHHQLRREAAPLAYIMQTLRRPWRSVRQMLLAYYKNGRVTLPRDTRLLRAYADAVAAFAQVSWSPTDKRQFHAVLRAQRRAFGSEYLPATIDALADCTVCQRVCTAMSRPGRGPTGLEHAYVDARGHAYCGRTSGRTADICNRTRLRQTHVTGRYVFVNGRAHAACVSCACVHALETVPYYTKRGLLCPGCRDTRLARARRRAAAREAAAARRDTKELRRQMAQTRKRKRMSQAAAARDVDRALDKRRRAEDIDHA